MTARRSIGIAGALATATGLWVQAAPASAPTVAARHSAALNRTVAVTATGRTLYHRARDSAHHILCGTVCAHVWPPLTVASATTPLVRGPGVSGALGRFRRPDGRWQVTLRGLPLYRFSGDARAGDAHGQGDGGIWSAVAASTASVHPPPPPPPPPGY